MQIHLLYLFIIKQILNHDLKVVFTTLTKSWCLSGVRMQYVQQIYQKASLWFVGVCIHVCPIQLENSICID